jgi:uncharacterized membrane protein YoaK (UPF0700 family)
VSGPAETAPSDDRVGRRRANRRFASYIADPKHGPLPALLLVLTIVTGLVDAASILALGRVFVANMTGNVVFIGFALAGAPGFSLAGSVSALIGFTIGALGGGAVIDRMAVHRGRLLRDTAAVESIMVAVAAIVAAATAPMGQTGRVGVAFLLAVALGVQNTSVRRLAVPDLTTTVLTMTITGIAADIRRSSYTVAMRRALSVVCMFAGAIVGAVLILHVNVQTPLAIAGGLVAVVAVAAAVASRRPAVWHDIS